MVPFWVPTKKYGTHYSGYPKRDYNFDNCPYVPCVFCALGIQGLGLLGGSSGLGDYLEVRSYNWDYNSPNMGYNYS